MRFVKMNFHILVFVFLTVSSSIWVASRPQRTVELLQPLVEDAQELEELAHGAYSDIKGAGRALVSADALSLYMGVIRMPTMLFEQLATRLSGVDRALQERQPPAPGMREPGRRVMRLPIAETFRFEPPRGPQATGI